MFKYLRRISVLKGHLQKDLLCRNCSSHATPRQPSITVTPSFCLVDKKIKIHVSGLQSKQLVTLVADVVENGSKFESRCLYQADDGGNVDNDSSSSLAGSFQGVEPMGLFWSIVAVDSQHPQRLMKKDVSAPMKFMIKVYSGDHTTNEISDNPLAQAEVHRVFMKPGVKRIRLTAATGKVRGTIFVPEGKGPFPGLIDTFGGLISLIETRAALLASHGYATLALSYLYAEDLPQMLLDTDVHYVRESYEWFMEQEYVDRDRMGAVGLCLGGYLSLHLASKLPQMKAVVNINGIPISPGNSKLDGVKDGMKWPQGAEHLVEKTDEGVVIKDVFHLVEPISVPAWQHGAKILVISGEDDKQVDPKWHVHYYENCPPEYRSNLQLHRYPGAGHLIEPPYMPHIRAMKPGSKRMMTIDFVPHKYKDEMLMSGGYAKEHAHAQEDSWNKILEFLHINLKAVV